MWINRSSDLPFVPKQPYAMWSFSQVVKWRGDKFPRNDVDDGRDPDRTIYPLLNREEEAPLFGRLADRCIMPILRALHHGKLRAYIQLESGFQPISKEVWAPDEHDEWPVGWLFGQLEDIPFGNGCPRDIEGPFRGATIMFLDSEVKRWAASDEGKPRLPSDRAERIAYERIVDWMRSFDTTSYTGSALFECAVEHFRPRIVLPFHVKKARRVVEGEPRGPGPKRRR